MVWPDWKSGTSMKWLCRHFMPQSLCPSRRSEVLFKLGTLRISVDRGEVEVCRPAANQFGQKRASSGGWKRVGLLGYMKVGIENE